MHKGQVLQAATCCVEQRMMLADTVWLDTWVFCVPPKPERLDICSLHIVPC